MTDGPGTRWEIVDALRRWGTDSTRLLEHFAGGHDLQPVDLRALVAIMRAQRLGEPLTPGRLRAHLGLAGSETGRQLSAVFLITVVAMPLLVVALGCVVWWRRR